MSATYGVTPSQTVGPYLALGLTWDDGADVVPAGTPGAVLLGGTVFDGAGEIVTDAMIETWQADPDGRFDHPDDPRGAVTPSVPGFRGFGRAATDAEGRWEIRTLEPGALPAEDGATEAPHLTVSVFARGLLDRVVTRVYFPQQAEANAADPVLTSVPAERRDTLVAVPDGEGRLRFDIHLQGERETVFFDC
ncbi:protocatechuate 3,4-dioxygenase alpha subunit [Pseudonocardia sediminis]|uniref:Protocatechuate 3,4-dioxygenase alpha subunit n=1 Tax=Pseudonocardia sediminis TaxID=1397368 RepID=A0A4Q7UWA5_PSEST|nr:protocatechuate 3,4-dioxygenase subunit alpha [Pseudonocardia sediminis]RZT84369.1 protocatechuate 3,4-dioxygenase alpha subunit [Pseudonocardia sediminis]